MTFKDHFSDRATLYAQFRPSYPEALFRIVAGLPPKHRSALDCGTGNGQAAVGLAEHFDRVIAIDPSGAQLAAAIPHARIEYRSAGAEQTGVASHSVDLVTAAQALHWFRIPAFFAEAVRVLVPGGAIAVWGYGDPILDNEALHETVHDFNRGTLESYWYHERNLLLDGYRSIDFPFREVEMPPLLLECRWTLAELVGYLRTWSAAARYAEEKGFDPVTMVEAELSRDWGDVEQTHLIRWPLSIRAGHAG